MYQVQRLVGGTWLTVSSHQLLGTAVRSAAILSLTLGLNNVAILRPGGFRRTMADISRSAGDNPLG